MSFSAGAAARAAAALLTDERARNSVGWVLAVIFSPVILVIALLCCLLGGTSQHNTSMVELCFHGGALPESVPAEYRTYMEDMQSSFSKLDELTEEINRMTEGDKRLDDTRVKAIFYALFFGTDAPEGRADQDFVDCFVTYEERTRTVTVTDEGGNEVEQEETYTVAVPITDLETIWSNVSAETGLTISAEQKRNADSIFISRRDALAEQLRAVKLEKERLLESEENQTIRQTQILLETLESGPEFLDTFNEELFRELVDKIIVESNERLRFRLINGLELTEPIERTVR